MPAPVTMNLRLEGDFPGSEFPEWISHRAHLLDLAGWVEQSDEHVIEV